MTEETRHSRLVQSHYRHDGTERLPGTGRFLGVRRPGAALLPRGARLVLAYMIARSARGQSGARPPHSKEAPHSKGRTSGCLDSRGP